jgi:hypothetical protein
MREVEEITPVSMVLGESSQCMKMLETTILSSWASKDYEQRIFDSRRCVRDLEGCILPNRQKGPLRRLSN